MSVYEKLRAVQVELHAPKNQVNKFGGYNYRSCEDILEAAKPVLDKHGLTLTISDSIEIVGDRIYVKATSVVSDGSESVSVDGWAREPAAQKGMAEPQLTGSASSYSRKYSLSGLFALDDNKDSDATNDHGKGSGGGNSSSPSTARSAPSNAVDTARADAIAALKANNVDGDAVKKFVRDMGFTGLSHVDNVDDLRKVVAWAELGAK